MAELLLELFSEEIPARMQGRASADLERLVGDALKAQALDYKGVRAYATPRRLALVVDGLPAAQPDVKEERRGPRADAPEKAIEGFLKSTGLSRDQLEERADKKGTFLYAMIEKKGQKTADVIAALLPGIVKSFPWPKSMRWGAASASTESLRWVRPLQSILCLFDGDVVDFEVDGVKSGNRTRGHRFHAPKAFAVKDFADYREKLRLAKVMLDPEERQQTILNEARALSMVSKVALFPDEALVIENAGLTEWPVVLMGEFDKAFLEVPMEVLTATMRGNQKYFSLIDPETRGLANKFICVANIEAADGGMSIIAGNQKVLSARLSDAKFFWDQDLKISLDDRLPKLQDIVFHEKLGSVAEKVERVAKLARELAPIAKAAPDLAARAARLAKADLVSGMVGEFPEVQGAMGGYYAERQGEDAQVAQAIKDHYAPKGPEDDCPTAPVSIAVALADKIDTLVGFFAIDEKPTGSKDPYALRRAALGVIRLITENGLRLPLKGCLELGCKNISESLLDRDLKVASKSQQEGRQLGHLQAAHEAGAKSVEIEDQMLSKALKLRGTKALTSNLNSSADTTSSLLDFFADRLKVQQREKGVPHDLIDAVFSLGGEDDLVRLLARVAALQNFLGTEDGANLLAGYKRAANILKIEEKKDGCAYDGSVKPDLLQDDAEKALAESLEMAKNILDDAIDQENFEAAMAALAKLRGPVDRFFDHVTVNADDLALRANRLNLLNQIRAAVHKVADFSKIEG